MKIYIEPNRISTAEYNYLKQNLPEVEFTETEDFDSDAIFVFPTYITSENIEKYQQLKWIQLMTAGFDQVDLEIVREKNILISNARGVYSKTIAEDVFCKILTINRNVKKYLEYMEQGEWKPIYGEPEICNSVIGIVGMGSIAQEIAKRMQAFEAKVIGYRRTNKQEKYFDEMYIGDKGLQEFLKISDYVILALPLNDDSYHFINTKTLAMMGPEAVLINISRGEIVDQDALVKALETKQIRAAGLDVTTPEPLPKGHKLWSLDNVFITPHNSVSSPLLTTRLTWLMEANLKKYINNKSLENLI